MSSVQHAAINTLSRGGFAFCRPAFTANGVNFQTVPPPEGAVGARSCVNGLSASSQSSPVPRPTWPSPTLARAPSSCSSNPATTARPPSPAGRWRPRWVRRGPRGPCGPRWRPGPFRCRYLSVWLISGWCGGRERGVGAGPPGVQRARGPVLGGSGSQPLHQLQVRPGSGSRPAFGSLSLSSDSRLIPTSGSACIR